MSLTSVWLSTRRRRPVNAGEHKQIGDAGAFEPQLGDVRYPGGWRRLPREEQPHHFSRIDGVQSVC